MIWKNSNFLKPEDFKKLKKDAKKIFKKYKIKESTLHLIVINKELRASDGRYLAFGLPDENELKQIDLAYKHYELFGIDSFIKILRHEIAHHISFMFNEGVNHKTFFKDTCLEINACLNDAYAVGKYKSLTYNLGGIETKYLWEYKCEYCRTKRRTKRKLSNNDLGCLNCHSGLDDLICRRL